MMSTFAAMWLAIGSVAQAGDLPGVPLHFDEDAKGRWVLPADLPADFANAGVEPGWALKEVEGQPLAKLKSPDAVRAQVARGPARPIQLAFDTKRGEVVVEVRRAPLVQAESIGVLPWPTGFTRAEGYDGWRLGRDGTLIRVDAAFKAWALDPDTGAQNAVTVDPDALPKPFVTPLYWSLAAADWVVLGETTASVHPAAHAASAFPDAVRLDRFQGEVGDHLAVPTPAGLEVYAITWPRGTASLPECTPAVPETCLVAGRQIAATLLDRPGGRQEAERVFGIACEEGVYRACLEAITLTAPDESAAARNCADQDVNACHGLGRNLLERDGETPSRITVGVLEYACSVDASGSLGERLRRLEDVGEGCMMLSRAFDARGTHDRALLSLDEACVLGRADACDEASRRRDEAFAMRTVQECEDTSLPLASSCVTLGLLLRERDISKTELDEFSAFQRGCELGDEQGCRYLGDYVDRWGITHPRVVGAESALLKACDGGEQRACVGGAHLLVRHEPRSPAYAQALGLFDKSCTAGIPAACIAGAEQRRIGSARQVVVPEPTMMWTSACNLASAPGCAGLGERLARSKPTWPDAFDAWTRACGIGDAGSCTDLGLLVENKHEPLWPDEQPPPTYLEQGCDNGDAEGCYWLGKRDMPKKEEPAEPAYILMERACQGEYGPACAELGDVHLRRKTSFDDELAASMLSQACEHGHYESCKELSVMYQRGKGVEKDRLTAKELAQKYSINARRRHVRVGVHAGFPFVAGGELELVAPIPVGPAISVTGSYSYLPGLGGPLVQLIGDTYPNNAPDLVYYDAGARIYPNNKARGLYAMAGWHQLMAQGGDLGANTLTRSGGSLRLGIHNENKMLYTRIEMGIANYGIVYMNDFDEDETGQIPLIQAVLGFSVGFGVL